MSGISGPFGSSPAPFDPHEALMKRAESLRSQLVAIIHSHADTDGWTPVDEIGSQALVELRIFDGAYMPFWNGEQGDENILSQRCDEAQQFLNSL